MLKRGDRCLIIGPIYETRHDIDEWDNFTNERTETDWPIGRFAVVESDEDDEWDSVLIDIEGFCADADYWTLSAPTSSLRKL